MPTFSVFGKNSQNLMGNGQSAQASMGYRFGRLLGIAGSYSYKTNTIRKDVMIHSLANDLESTWNAQATNCTFQSLMVGPLLSVPAGRFIFDFQLSGGLAQAKSSHMEMNTEYQQIPLTFTTPSKTTRALAAGAGFTARFKLNRWLALQATAQYITADLKYDNLVQEIQVGSQLSTEILPSSQPTGLLTLGGGFSFLF